MDQGMTMNLTELLAAKAALDAEIAKAKKTEATGPWAFAARDEPGSSRQTSQVAQPAARAGTGVRRSRKTPTHRHLYIDPDRR